MGIEIRSIDVKPSQAILGQLEASVIMNVDGNTITASVNGTNNPYLLAEKLYKEIRQHTFVEHKVDKITIDSRGAVVALSNYGGSFEDSASGSIVESSVRAYAGALNQLMHHGA